MKLSYAVVLHTKKLFAYSPLKNECSIAASICHGLLWNMIPGIMITALCVWLKWLFFLIFSYLEEHVCNCMLNEWSLPCWIKNKGRGFETFTTWAISHWWVVPLRHMCSSPWAFTATLSHLWCPEKPYFAQCGEVQWQVVGIGGSPLADSRFCAAD